MLLKPLAQAGALVVVLVGCASAPIAGIEDSGVFGETNASRVVDALQPILGNRNVIQGAVAGAAAGGGLGLILGEGGTPVGAAAAIGGMTGVMRRRAAQLAASKQNFDDATAFHTDTIDRFEAWSAEVAVASDQVAAEVRRAAEIARADGLRVREAFEAREVSRETATEAMEGFRRRLKRDQRYIDDAREIVKNEQALLEFAKADALTSEETTAFGAQYDALRSRFDRAAARLEISSVALDPFVAPVAFALSGENAAGADGFSDELFFGVRAPSIYGENDACAAGDIDADAVFPVPAPARSQGIALSPHETRLVLRDLGVNVGASETTLEDAVDALVAELRRRGYVDPRYYAAPLGCGVVLVTGIERILSDGAPADDDERFLAPGEETDFNLADFLRRILFAQPGYFRVFVFALGDSPLIFETTLQPTVSAAVAAQSLLDLGAAAPPDELATASLTREMFLEVAVYEFERLPRRDAPEDAVRQIERLDARVHLLKSELADIAALD